MNPLQKKCIIATAGCHLLLVVILFLGPGFFRQSPPPDNLPVLKVLPANAVDAAMSSGSVAAQAAPPTPVPPTPTVVPPPTPTPPSPEPPKPEVAPTPTPQPEVQPAKPVEPVEPEVPDKPDDTPDPAPAPKPVKHHDLKHDISLTPVVRVVNKKHVHDTTAEDQAAAEEEKAEHAEARRRAAAIARLTGSLEHNLNGSTEITMPGAGSQSYANYGQIVKSIYENAWNPPDSADSDEASPKVRVVIARDGSVISAHIVTPSGDRALDESVQRTLDRVTFIRPFPDGATENQRSYIINFNLKAKRMLG